MNRTAIILAGVAALAALFFLCAKRHIGTIETDLTTRTAGVLAEANLGWAEIGASGRDISIDGTAPNQLALDTALGLARDVPGVRRVQALASVGPADAGAEYQLIGSVAGSSLRLVGMVPNEASRDAVVVAAKNRFSDGEVIDELRVVPGAPASWARVAAFLVERAGDLDEGQFLLSGNQLRLTGRVPDAATRDRVAEALSTQIPDGFETTIELSIPGDAGIDAAGASAEDACQKELDWLMRSNQIEFRTGSAVLRDESSGLLNTLIDVVAQCPEADVEIAGHTDATGDASANLNLSLERADAVVEYLAAGGISAERMVARGYGAERPIADNATAAGRARNRRIEFTIVKD